MTQAYEYKPLERGHIRLLQLLDSDREIRGKIYAVSLDSHPEYKALSYEWGDPTPRQRISVDGSALYIAENLATALPHLKDLVGPYIWIDAICINQSDMQERGQQVSQMARIYRQATQVLVWLGPSAEESDLAMDGLNRYGREAFEAGIMELSRPTLLKWPDVGDDRRLVEITSNLLGMMRRATNAEDDNPAAVFPRIPFARLTHRGYFERAWVKQELILAADPLMICGEKTVPQVYFHAGILFYGLWTLWEIAEFQAGRTLRMPGPFSFGRLLEELHASGGDPQAAHKLQSQGEISEASGRLFAGRGTYYERKSSTPMIKYLSQSYIQGGSFGLKCKDDRDRIYALLGLFDDAEELGLYPDYSQGTEVLYEKVARALFGQGHIDVLRFCRSRKLELPSWVPDWTASIRPSWSDEGLFNASRAVPLPAEYINSFGNIPGVLRIRGARVDTIVDCGSVWTAGLTDKFDLPAAQKLFADVEAFLGRARYTAEERAEAAWRVPIGDKESHPSASEWQRATSRSCEQRKVLAAAKLTQNQERDTHSYQSIMRYMYDARSFLSTGGYVGLCPKESVPGDVICILVGGQVPYILRPKGEAAYTLIGEAYVHGIMDGEFLDDNADAHLEILDLY